MVGVWAGEPCAVRDEWWGEHWDAAQQLRREQVQLGEVNRAAMLRKMVAEPLGVNSVAESWAHGARPVGAGARMEERRVVETNLGTAFLDSGATKSFILGPWARTLAGVEVVRLDDPVEVFPAGAGELVPVFVAREVARAEVTVFYSFDDKERGRVAGLKPVMREFSMDLELLVCDDERVLESLVSSLPGLKVVLGEDVEKVPGFQVFYTYFLRAVAEGVDYTPLWTHAQRTSQVNLLKGTGKDAVLEAVPAAVAFDAPDLGVDLPYGLRSPLELDSALAFTEAVVKEDRGASMLPKSVEEMMGYLNKELVRKGRVVEKYLRQLAEIVLDNVEVLLDPRPSDKVEPWRPRARAGAVPTREGLRRRVQPHCLPGLNEEVEKLFKLKLVEPVPLVDGRIPDDLWVNGLVVTVRRVPPGSPAGTKPKLRMCVDCTPVNRVLAEDQLTLLPNLDQHVESFAGCSLFSAGDSPSAYHQYPLDHQGRNLFGFCVPRADGTLALWRFTGACFGGKIFPGMWQQEVDGPQGITRDVRECPFTRCGFFLDDLAIGTTFRDGKRLEDVWGTAEEAEMVGYALLALRRALEGYKRKGLVISLRKCDFLQETIGICGILTDGVSRQIDPQRKDGWENLAKPDKVNLAFLQHALGVANYCQPFLPVQYLVKSEPLFELARQAARAVSAAGVDKAAKRGAAQFVQDNWSGTHDEALAWIVKEIRDSQLRYFLDYNRRVHVLADASDSGVAGLIGQYDAQGVFRICFTLCKRFTSAQKLWSVGARECYGWLIVCRRWWKVLAFVGDLVFQSDHQNLVTSVADLENVHVKRWVVELSQWEAFTRHRVHRRGESNLICDTLSRCAFGNDFGSGNAVEEGSPILREYLRVRKAVQAKAGAGVGPLRGGGAGAAPVVEDDPQMLAAKAAELGCGGKAAVVVPKHVELFNNPHKHSLSRFLDNVLAAQQKFTLEEQEHLVRKLQGVKRTFMGKDVWFVRGRVLVPEDQQLLGDIFRVVHDDNLHAGEGVVLDCLRRACLFVPNFGRHFGAYYSSCECQHARAPKQLQKQGAFLLGPRYYVLSHVSMDFMSLPITERGGKTFVGALLLVDQCSRVCQVTAVKDMTGKTAVDGLERWFGTWGVPVMVLCDGGPHFTGGDVGAFLQKCGVLLDVGTPHHPRGRGLVERHVRKVKDGLARLLPQGKLLEWPRVMNELERKLNMLPHSGLGGVSPFDYLIRGHKDRHVVGREFEVGTYGLAAVMKTVQDEENLGLVLDSLRQVADWCGEIGSLKRSVASQQEYVEFKGVVGDLVLKYVAFRQNSLEPMYQGPYKITEAYGSDFFKVQEWLAGGALGDPVDVHASRLILFDGSRTSGTAEHARKLPEGYYVVESILDGPNEKGQFQVKWFGVDNPTWEAAAGLRTVVCFKKYCHDNKLTAKGERRAGAAKGKGKAEMVARLVCSAQGVFSGEEED